MIEALPFPEQITLKYFPNVHSSVICVLSQGELTMDSHWWGGGLKSQKPLYPHQTSLKTSHRNSRTDEYEVKTKILEVKCINCCSKGNVVSWRGSPAFSKSQIKKRKASSNVSLLHRSLCSVIMVTTSRLPRKLPAAFLQPMQSRPLKKIPPTFHQVHWTFWLQLLY
ncbi:hypothetical protein CDAR_126311 [Caerostris darwini]|uniref:Uncharacterized protein n=1 Tax=Caerostris darwini TaxID=1538125 RepID=A0AAV4R4Y0_9ARAC|nr:hypothetical protein CDAR_126311 [Caerostris darwini]